GRVEFYTTRTPVANASLQGKVVGNAGAGGNSGEVIVYANNTIDVASSLTGSANTLDTLVSIVNADYASFMGTSTQNLGTAYSDALKAFRGDSQTPGSLQTVGFSAVPPSNSVNMGVNVRPAVELKDNGNLQIGPGVVNSQWDLTQPTLLVDNQ